MYNTYYNTYCLICVSQQARLLLQVCTACFPLYTLFHS